MSPGQQVLKVIKVHLELQAPQVPRARLVHKDPLESLAQLVPRAPRVIKGPQVSLAQQVRRVKQVQRAHKVHPESRDQLDLREIRAVLESPEQLALPAHKGTKAVLVSLAQLVPQDRRAHLESQVRRVLRVHQV